MLLRAELLGVELAQATDDGKRGELRLGGEPAFDRSDVGIEHGRRAHTSDVSPFWPPVRATRLAGFEGLSERPGKGRCIGRRRWHRTTVDAIAELGLGSAHLADCTAVGSSESAPAITLSIAAASSALRVMGPTWSKDGASGNMPARLTRPQVGFKPVSPFMVDGKRIDPKVSVPVTRNKGRRRSRRPNRSRRPLSNALNSRDLPAE